MHADFIQRIAEEREVDKIFSPTFHRRRNRELHWLLTQPEAYLDDINHQVLEFAARQENFAAWAARKPTVIVGAGTSGVTAQVLLARHGVRIAAFLDDAAEAGTVVNGVPVQTLPQSEDVQALQFLFAERKAGKAVKQRLQAAGVAAGDLKSFEPRWLSWE